MIIVKSPFRLSLFGGSSDYEDFYTKHGSFLIGTTIDKYYYQSIRYRPSIMPQKSIISSYSTLEEVDDFNKISNPLIRETFKFYHPPRPIEFNSFSDIPGRTGLGGSSSYCVGLCYLLHKLLKLPIDKHQLATDAITIERKILKESGGIQDQIWASYGGLNSITINTNGKFFVRPLPVTPEFRKEFQESFLLIYTGEQRQSERIAKSHENKDKISILKIANEAYTAFINEDIKHIGELLYEAWKEKKKISILVTSSEIDTSIQTIMSTGAYGAKLIGSGGCGFILAICNSHVKQLLSKMFEGHTLDIKFDYDGVAEIYKTHEKVEI